MSKKFEDRFIIDCYGIIDTDKPLTGKCEEDRLSWEELCNTLNDLYISADFNNEKLLRENRKLKKEIWFLRSYLDDIESLVEKARDYANE